MFPQVNLIEVNLQLSPSSQMTLGFVQLTFNANWDIYGSLGFPMVDELLICKDIGRRGKVPSSAQLFHEEETWQAIYF